jgi:hypothetical protein
MTVKLCSVFNPDFPRRDQNLIEPVLIPVDDIKGASIVCQSFIDASGIGGGNWANGAGEVRGDDGKIIAHISYNGRAWKPSKSIYNRKETTF